jgi:hypothetical protein
MYCWTLLSRNISATPYLMGVTDDLAKARKLCEPHLVSRRAFLGYIQAVRPAVTARGLDSCYVPVGPAWLGRLRDRNGVGWREQELWADRGKGDNPHA